MNKQQITAELFQAYYDARENKRGRPDAIRFEMNYERNLFALAEEIASGQYRPGPSICFVVDKPVKREVFAAEFRDRVVHHFIFNRLNPIFEPRFINDAYSCRLGKGTSYGIRRLDHFIRSCSENYQKDCYILKLDIKGYFMAINRRILYDKVMGMLRRVPVSVETLHCNVSTGEIGKLGNWEIDLIRGTIFNDPAGNCIVKGRRNDWAGLPKSKSLFFARPGCGLPIGNLTSQLFSNIYLSEFDHFVKGFLGCKYYGRYVDDFVIVHPDKDFLKALIPEIRNYLKDRLELDLHEKKIYLQHFSRSVKFLGAIIKPYRLYIASRTKGNFYDQIRRWNILLHSQENQLKPEQVKAVISSANSYLGLLKHYRTARLRRKIFDSFSVYWWNFAYIHNNVVKTRPW
jgi:RNA-directed DNA polymerase